MKEFKERGERIVASLAHGMGSRREPPREREKDGDCERNERHEGDSQRGRPRKERRSCREHCDDGDEKSGVELAYESAYGIGITRQLGDQFSIGEWKKFGGGEVHDSIERLFLERQFNVVGTREDEPLQAGRQYGLGEQQRGEDGERADGRSPVDERVDEVSGRKRNRDLGDGRCNQKR